MSASLLQLLGGVLTVAACGLLGQALAKALSTREKALATLCHGLALLATEIDYGATPLPQALLQISQRLDGEVGNLFRSAACRLQKEKGVTADVAWQEALAASEERLPLNGGDMAILYRFGQGLGQSHREDQLRRLQLIGEQLTQRQKEAIVSCQKQGKVWRSLGWSAGIILFLMWI